MEIVFGAHHLIAPGGADTYLLTVKEVEEFKQIARWRLAERLGSPLDRVRRSGRGT